VLVGRVSERRAEANETLRAPSVSVAEIRSGVAAAPEEDKAANF
jgi:hypothetical protein